MYKAEALKKRKLKVTHCSLHATAYRLPLPYILSFSSVDTFIYSFSFLLLSPPLSYTFMLPHLFVNSVW